MSSKRARNVPVTDHAVLRYLERHGYVDVEAARRQIFAECQEALNSGATKLQINGTEYRMENGVVITVISRRKRSGKLNWRKSK